MLIVAGHFIVGSGDQAAFVAGRTDAMGVTRAESGCLEYAITADPLDETRVLLFERWADQAAFDAHMARRADAPKAIGPPPKGVEIKIYDVATVREFG